MTRASDSRAPGPASRTDLEQEWRHLEKMRILGSLAGGLAHDSNNLLFAILGATERIEHLLPVEHPALPMLAIIRQAVDRARDLNRQILDFSRDGGGRRESFDLAELIRESIQLVQVTLPGCITVRVDPLPATWILGDSNQIQQVFLNLAINAHKAMLPAGGELAVRLDRLAGDGMVPPLPAGSYARLTVADTGCGMSAAVLERIFTPFFTTRATQEGTGLGLAMAQRIVQRHGGLIQATSVFGKGSCFKVLLPAGN